VEAQRDPGAPVRVELRGISIYTHHGVTDAEQEVGQMLEIDVALEPARCDAVRTDELADTTDYSEVADLVVATATETSYRTLERLAAVIGERLLDSFDVDAVRVRAAKPEPPMPLTIGAAGVIVTTRRGPGTER
jgi:7,8-dihydroneopterin aldolase/epimerase/oxygenase